MSFRALGCVVAVASVVLLLLYGHVFRGWFVPKLTLSEHTEMLAPYFSLSRPDQSKGSAAPTAIFMPGCLGQRRHHQLWSDALLKAGWATIIVDSFTPRGVTQVQQLERVCDGARPWGFERGADVVSAVEFITANPSLDNARIALFGWSHGGWAVMDAMSFGESSKPTNLTSLPRDWADGIVATVLFYPYCGFGTRTATHGWAVDVPTLLYIGQEDSNVSPDACAQAARRISRDGGRLEMVLLDGVTHWFDNPGDFDIAAHRYEPILTKEIRMEVLDDLDTLSP